MQSTRNRRCGQRQHIEANAPFFQPLLLRHAEPLFFIDHQQSQIFKGNIRLQQPMRTDQQIHFAFSRPLQYIALFGRRTEAADHVHSQAKGGKSAGKGLKMLLGQHRSRHQHRNLFAAHDGFERGPQGHFGFTKTHVAA